LPYGEYTLKGFEMRRNYVLAVVLAVFAVPAAAQERAIVAQPKVDASAANFDGVLRQALGGLVRAGSYTVDVDAAWGAAADERGPKGGSHYRLAWQGGRYRVEVQSLESRSPDLISVHDGAQVTTYFPARKLYSQHAADSPQATLEASKMLALSLQGSALDILLQRDVGRYVQAQATGLKDHGEAMLGGKKTRHFELLWAGAKVELYFAAEGDPLLLAFTRTTSVPVGVNQHYEMVCTAKFQWRLGEVPRESDFAIALPADAHRVNEIYEALSGRQAATPASTPLPKLTLSKLDGSDVELTAVADKKATVLIFWATWCAASVEDFPAVQKLVAGYKDRGVAFYAINVGESPGEVRRFTAKTSLVSAVLLDPRSQTSSALQICELPAIAIVAPDNTIRAVLHGSAKALQADLAAQLEGLLANPASATARRPADSSGRQK
jgi:thiol-disulfide isomerase/thioredoxin